MSIVEQETAWFRTVGTGAWIPGTASLGASAVRFLRLTPEPEIPPPTDGWPDATNTGWARTGVTLTPYSGPTTLSGTVLIDKKSITTDLVIGYSSIATTVTIKRCNITGRIDCDGPNYNVILEDCNLNGSTADAPVVGYGNLTVRRCNIIGGANSVIGGDNVLVEDSWLHAQYLGPTRESHENAFISNGGTGITLRNCTLHADQPNNTVGGGVSTNCSLFGDFAPIADVLIEDCLIKATPGAYGVSLGYNPGKPYGSNPTNVVFQNNTFEPGTTGNCGQFGPVTGWLDDNGNVFTGNVWLGGGVVSPA